ncbi:hypothetical protein CMO91_00020 [Candidatus Woesearchaeota archaeon]|nr:hypothetical protein [Candidatus Woesearchaeota archaeon]
MATPEQEFILYVIGSCQEALDRKYAAAPISVRLSKQAFIQLALRSGVAKKQERALYKNMQNLEERKFIVYENKHLTLTGKGHKWYEQVKKKMGPYLLASRMIDTNVIAFMDKAPTMFKNL